MAVSKNKGLGKGLGALLGNEPIPDNEARTILDLSIQEISPNGEQPRKHFDKEKLQELSNSIRENGVIQPIIVTKAAKGYQIVAGERRWRAARGAGLKTIPAIVRELSSSEVLQQALIENVQRQDLNPIETAQALKRLMVDHEMTQEKLSSTVGMSRPAVANTLRLLNLNKKLQAYVVSEEISAGHARTILSLEDEKQQEEVADLVIQKELSVRDTEKLVKRLLEPRPEPRKAAESPVEEAYQLSIQTVEKELTGILGTKVSLKDKKKKGEIVIEYYSMDDLDRILDILKNKDS